jgi:hypothetical protein
MDTPIVMFAQLIRHPLATVEFLEQKLADMGPCALMNYQTFNAKWYKTLAMKPESVHGDIRLGLESRK